MNRVLPLTLLGTIVSISSAGVLAMDLEEAYNKALSNDPSWSAIQNLHSSSQEAAEQARSGLLPNVSASGSIMSTHTVPKEPLTFGGMNVVPNGTYTNQTIGLQAVQPLFNADSWYGYHKAKAAVSRSDADFVGQQQQFILKVAQAYFNVLRAEESLAYAKAQELAIGRQLEQTKKRFEVGLIAITEVHEAQAAYDSSVADRIGADSAVTSAQEALTSITGDMDTQIAILRSDAPVSDLPTGNMEDWVKLAKEKNPQIVSAQFGYQAAQEATKQSRADHLPTLNLVGSWQNTDTGGANKFVDGRTTAVGLQLTVPLYTGGRVESGVRQAVSQEYAAKDQLAYAERTVVQDTRTQYRSVTTDSARVSARKQAVVSSESALVATQAGYDVGTRDIVEVLQAQRNLYASKSAYASARYDYVLDGLRLKATAGQLSAIDIRDLNKWLDKSGSISVDSLNPETANPPVTNTPVQGPAPRKKRD